VPGRVRRLCERRSSGSKILRSFGAPIVCRWKSINPAWRCRGSSNALADQLRRASKSICANLAEGFAKQSYSAAEYRRYLTVAIGSSDETQLWLRYCIDLGYIEDVVGQRWIADYVEISRMLQGLYASWSRSS
jgi:four helix bundle protein